MRIVVNWCLDERTRFHQKRLLVTPIFRRMLVDIAGDGNFNAGERLEDARAGSPRLGDQRKHLRPAADKVGEGMRERISLRKLVVSYAEKSALDFYEVPVPTDFGINTPGYHVAPRIGLGYNSTKLSPKDAIVKQLKEQDRLARRLQQLERTRVSIPAHVVGVGHVTQEALDFADEVYGREQQEQQHRTAAAVKPTHPKTTTSQPHVNGGVTFDESFTRTSTTLVHHTKATTTNTNATTTTMFVAPDSIVDRVQRHMHKAALPASLLSSRTASICHDAVGMPTPNAAFGSVNSGAAGQMAPGLYSSSLSPRRHDNDVGDAAQNAAAVLLGDCIRPLLLAPPSGDAVPSKAEGMASSPTAVSIHAQTSSHGPPAPAPPHHQAAGRSMPLVPMTSRPMSLLDVKSHLAKMHETLFHVEGQPQLRGIPSHSGRGGSQRNVSVVRVGEEEMTSASRRGSVYGRNDCDDAVAGEEALTWSPGRGDGQTRKPDGGLSHRGPSNADVALGVSGNTMASVTFSGAASTTSAGSISEEPPLSGRAAMAQLLMMSRPPTRQPFTLDLSALASSSTTGAAGPFSSRTIAVAGAVAPLPKYTPVLPSLTARANNPTQSYSSGRAVNGGVADGGAAGGLNATVGRRGFSSHVHADNSGPSLGTAAGFASSTLGGLTPILGALSLAKRRASSIADLTFSPTASGTEADLAQGKMSRSATNAAAMLAASQKRPLRVIVPSASTHASSHVGNGESSS